MADGSYLTDAKRLKAGFAIFNAFLCYYFFTKYGYTATYAI
jgi:hypothetical protein